MTISDRKYSWTSLGNCTVTKPTNYQRRSLTCLTRIKVEGWISWSTWWWTDLKSYTVCISVIEGHQLQPDQQEPGAEAGLGLQCVWQGPEWLHRGRGDRSDGAGTLLNGGDWVWLWRYKQLQRWDHPSLWHGRESVNLKKRIPQECVRQRLHPEHSIDMDFAHRENERTLYLSFCCGVTNILTNNQNLRNITLKTGYYLVW